MSSRRPPAALPPGVVATAPVNVLPPLPPPPPHRRHQHVGAGQFDHTAPRPPVPGEECVQVGEDWGNMQGQQVDYPSYADMPSPASGGGAAPLTPHKVPYVNHLGNDVSMMPPPKRPISSKRYLYEHLEYSGKPPLADPPMKNSGYYKDSYHHQNNQNCHRGHPHQSTIASSRVLDDPRSESPSYTTATTTTTNSSSSSGNQIATSSSACLRWAMSLHFLLQDVDGSDLFRRFLRAEHPDHAADALDFWFACEGLRTHNDPKTVGQLVKLIYKRYFRKPTLPYISEQMRAEIGSIVKSLGSGQTPPITIFDDAQALIEEAISNNTYRHFLESDMYLQYIQAMQYQTSCSESGSSSSSSNNLANFQKNTASLPTIPEDSPPPSNALHTPVTDCMNSGCHTPQLTKGQLYKTQNARSKIRPTPEEGFVRNLGGSHLTPSYYSYNPVSRRDSEQQSVSSQSDVCTDDNRSHTDSSIDGRSFHRQAKQYARRNQETELNAMVIPRTQRRDSRQCPPTHPDEFAALLTDKLNSFLKKKKEQELFKRKLQEIESTSSLGEKCHPQNHERTTEAIVDEDDSQGILDEHVSRVFSQDHSPTRNIHRSSNIHTSKRQHRDATSGIGSTFSGDSGNVHDYYSDTQRHSHGNMIKSHSMPEYYLQQQQTCASASASAVFGAVGAGGNSAATVGRRSTTGKRLTLAETDSGVSVVSDTPPVVPDRVLNWVLESEIETREIPYTHSEMSHGSNQSSRHQQISTATTAAYQLSRHYGVGAPAYGNSRSSSVERSGGAGAAIGGGPAQPFVADPSLPMPLPPNTASQLEETVRRLEDMRSGVARNRNAGLSNQRLPASGRYHQELGSLSAHSTLARSSYRSSKSAATSLPQHQQQQLPVPDSGTTVLVKFCEEEIPYRITIPGHHVTLRQFKEYLPKKGLYRYFFKTKCDELDNQVIQEEVSHDDVVLPLWEGKIITATVKPID